MPTPRLDRERLTAALEEAVRESGAPGAAACVGDVQGVTWAAAVGLRQRYPVVVPNTLDTLYDLASLTKVMATTTAVLQLRDAGALSLDDPVARWLDYPLFRRITLRHCLTHTAGFVGYRTWYTDITSMDDAVARAAQETLSGAPGTSRRYSDIGFMLLGRVVERVTGETLDTYCARAIFNPIGLRATQFNPGPAWRERAASAHEK